MDMIALFDLDDTLADYRGQVLRDLKRIASDGEPPVAEVFSTKPYLSARRKMITAQVGWWLNLPKFQLGWDVLEVVKELGYSVSILTKGPKTNHTAWSEKLQWCNKHLVKYIDGVTICHDKSIVYGAVLVDDFPAYIKSWLDHRPRGLVIMPAHDYNSDFIHPQVVRYDGTNILEVRTRLSERRAKDGESSRPLIIDRSD
jgi:5'-nucleotidase